MNEMEKINIELDILLSLQHVPAWTGSLGNLKQSSYVLYTDVIEMINKRRKIIREYEKNRTRVD